MADILLALDRGDIAFLILLDLSSAFDTVDHATLLKRMEISYVSPGGASDNRVRSPRPGLRKKT